MPVRARMPSRYLNFSDAAVVVCSVLPSTDYGRRAGPVLLLCKTV